MKPFILICIHLILLSRFSVTAVEVDFGALPKCTLSCLLTQFYAADCSLTDTACQCENNQVTESVTHCMISNCTVAESLDLGLLRDKVCQREPESRSGEILVVKTAMASLAMLSILLRLLSRYAVGRTIYLDDYAMILNLVLVIAISACGTWMVTHGLGQHTWYIAADIVIKNFQLFWVGEILYVLIILVTKTSILLFYMRIFPSHNFHIWVKGALGFVILPSIIFMVLLFVQCMPVAYNWDKSIDSGKCLNMNAITYAHGGINIAQDLLILALPLPQLIPLKLKLSQKIGVFIMFQIGILACLTSMFRLRFLFKFGGSSSTDPLWDNSDVTIWTSAEYNTAIICSCLPSIRVLYETGRKKANEALYSSWNSRAPWQSRSNPIARSPSPHEDLENAVTEHDLKLQNFGEMPLPPKLDKNLPATPVYRLSWETTRRISNGPSW